MSRYARPRVLTRVLLVLVCGLCLGWATSPVRGAYIGLDLYTVNAPSGYNNPNVVKVSGGITVGTSATPANATHAIVWDQTGTPMDLQPSNFPGLVVSMPWAVQGSEVVGQVSGSAAHAALWNGTASSAVDLTPNLGSASALGIGGNQEVGYGAADSSTPVHARLWTGTAASMVDLQPTDLGSVQSSQAWATDGIHQVGNATLAGKVHAILWSGTAGSAVDLQPTSLLFAGTMARGVSGNQQVGIGIEPSPLGIGPQHAVLWTGTADSAVDLNPSALGFTSSVAWATNGVRQVGDGYINGDSFNAHAITWTGTADSAVDLHQFLPAGFASSAALSIDASGDIFGVATDLAGNQHAVEWVVPEPSTIPFIGLLVVSITGLRRRDGLPDSMICEGPRPHDPITS